VGNKSTWRSGPAEASGGGKAPIGARVDRWRKPPGADWRDLSEDAGRLKGSAGAGVAKEGAGLTLPTERPPGGGPTVS